MSEYVKKFETAVSADNYIIADIPFITSIATDPIQNLHCDEENKKLVNNNGVVTVKSVGPSNDEIWYTATSRVTPNKTDVFGATYLPGESTFDETTKRGILKFDNDVTSIGKMAFKSRSGLTSVTIPDSVTSIGEQAFALCSNLTSVTIPNSVTSIGNYAFNQCSGLTSIEIPSNVTNIGNYAFMKCSGLTSIEIPNSVTSIGEQAFRGCIGLTSVSVEAGNTVYDSRNNCNAIIKTSTNTLICGCKNTIIPNNVRSIGQYAFEKCSGLTSVTIPNSVTSIGEGAFSYCAGLTSVTIPNSVTSIEQYAFNQCSGLTSVMIGNSVTSIGYAAFASCSGLTSVTCEAITPPTCGQYVFNSTNDCPIYVPAQSVDTYKAKTNWSTYASRIQAIQ